MKNCCKRCEYSKEISYALFRMGKTIKEIAEERRITENTVETHMIYLHSQEIQIF